MKTQALEETKLSPSCLHNNSSAEGAHSQKLVSTEKTRSSNVKQSSLNLDCGGVMSTENIRFA